MNLKQQVLLTGSTGFIGSKTADFFQHKGLEVKPFKGDVRRISDWVANLEKDQVVFHFAAVRTETERDFEVNTEGTNKLFLAGQTSGKIPSKVVFASSQAVYFGCQPPFTETLNLNPPNVFYGESKLQAERLAMTACQMLKVPLVVLRYSTTIGPGIRQGSSMSGPLQKWVPAGLKGEPIIVFQDGEQTRDYIHVDDIIQANWLALTKINEGIFNVGGSKAIKLKDLAEWVKEATGGKSKIIIAGGGPTPADPRHLFSDTRKLQNFGWRPKKTVKEAVEEYIKSLVSNI